MAEVAPATTATKQKKSYKWDWQKHLTWRKKIGYLAFSMAVWRVLAVAFALYFLYHFVLILIGFTMDIYEVQTVFAAMLTVGIVITIIMQLRGVYTLGSICSILHDQLATTNDALCQVLMSKFNYRHFGSLELGASLCLRMIGLPLLSHEVVSEAHLKSYCYLLIVNGVMVSWMILWG